MYVKCMDEQLHSSLFNEIFSILQSYMVAFTECSSNSAVLQIVKKNFWNELNWGMG